MTSTFGSVQQFAEPKIGALSIDDHPVDLNNAAGGYSKAIHENCEDTTNATNPRPFMKYLDEIPVFDVPRGKIIPDELICEIEAEEC